MALADLLISPGYQKNIPDGLWEEVSREEDYSEWGYKALTVNLKTKNPVFHPQIKYQIEPGYINTKIVFLYSRKHRAWFPDIGTGLYLNSGFIQSFCGKVNLSQSVKQWLRWQWCLRTCPEGCSILREEDKYLFGLRDKVNLSPEDSEALEQFLEASRLKKEEYLSSMTKLMGRFATDDDCTIQIEEISFVSDDLASDYSLLIGGSVVEGEGTGDYKYLTLEDVKILGKQPLGKKESKED